MNDVEDDKNWPGRGRSERPLTLYLKGAAMGAADIVPGVSGGTMALIMGIYARLIGALRSLASGRFLGSIGKGRWREAQREADLGFLLLLAAGIATSVLLLSRLLSSLLASRPEFVFAFFFGLVLASVWLVAGRIGRMRGYHWLLLVAGAAGAFLFVGLAPAETPENAWFLFLSGAVAISALLLPGVSGAFILVLMGKYEFVLAAITRFDLGPLLPILAGAAVGLLSFAQFLGWLLRRYRGATLAVLAGMMLGSLRRVWPWQQEFEGGIVNLPPPDLLSLQDGLLWALLLALAGAAAVIALERSQRGRRSTGGSDTTGPGAQS